MDPPRIRYMALSADRYVYVGGLGRDQRNWGVGAAGLQHDCHDRGVAALSSGNRTREAKLWLGRRVSRSFESTEWIKRGSRERGETHCCWLGAHSCSSPVSSRRLQPPRDPSGVAGDVFSRSVASLRKVHCRKGRWPALRTPRPLSAESTPLQPSSCPSLRCR